MSFRLVFFPFSHIYHNSLLTLIGSGHELKNRRRISMIRFRPSMPGSDKKEKDVYLRLVFSHFQTDITIHF